MYYYARINVDIQCPGSCTVLTVLLMCLCMFVAGKIHATFELNAISEKLLLFEDQVSRPVAEIKN